MVNFNSKSCTGYLLSDDIQDIKYNGSAATTQIVIRAKDKLKNFIENDKVLFILSEKNEKGEGKCGKLYHKDFEASLQDFNYLLNYGTEMQQKIYKEIDFNPRNFPDQQEGQNTIFKKVSLQLNIPRFPVN